PYTYAPVKLARRHGVDDPQRQLLALDTSLEADRDCTLVPGEPVHHRVLDERLQDQARNPGARVRLAGGNLDGEPIGEAPLLQLEVQSDKLQLIREARELALPGVQEPPQQIAELHHHRLGRRRVPGDLPADGT